MKPSVLQLIGSFHQGGSERQGVQMTRLLCESSRYEVHVACLSDAGVLRGEVERLGFTRIPTFPLASFHDWNTLVQLRRFSRYLREHRVDVIQTYDFYTNLFGLTAAALARVPVRIGARRETEGIRSPLQSWTERRCYCLAHTIVANSDAVRQQLLREGIRADRIAIIYNGMDTSRVAPRPDLSHCDTLDALNLPTEAVRRFVTIVANMRHAAKDQATFLRAAQRVRSAIPGAAFVLAGEGELMAPLRTLAVQLGLSDDVFFIGRCARIAELLAISEVCVLSSRGIEGFSNSILEYMAAARPVVATDVGGAREAIVEGETGYVVPPGDDAAMAARLIGLLQAPARARALGEAGLQRVQRAFSCEAQLERTEELYDRLLRAACDRRLRLERQPSDGVR